MINKRQTNAKPAKERAPQKIKRDVVDKRGEAKTKPTKSRYSDVIKKVTDRGSEEFNSRAAYKEGEIMEIAERNVVTAYPTTPVKDVAELMDKNHFRRIPITDPGTGRLEGMAVGIDLLDFLGGGEKYNIILNEYNGNFLSAINSPIRKIMFREYSSVDKQASITDVVKIILEKRQSAIPIVDDKKVIAIVTERDILPSVEKLEVPVSEIMREDAITSSKGMMISDVSKIMVRNRKRRLPVIENDRVVGIVTVFDVLRFLGKGQFNGIDSEDVLSERVENIMTPDVAGVSPKQDISRVMALIDETGFGGFPVVENENLIGIVTITDVLKAIYR